MTRSSSSGRPDPQRPLFSDPLLPRPGAYSPPAPRKIKALLDVRPLINQGSPSFTNRDPLPLARLPNSDMPVPGAREEYTYRLGTCIVILTHDGGTYGWHLSISHKTRYPLWDEIAEARYRCLPADICMAMILPPPDEYMNLHPNCFQLVEIPLPDTTAVTPPEPSNAPPRETPC
jgi:hypothetical protein